MNIQLNTYEDTIVVLLNSLGYPPTPSNTNFLVKSVLYTNYHFFWSYKHGCNLIYLFYLFIRSCGGLWVPFKYNIIKYSLCVLKTIIFVL